MPSKSVEEVLASVRKKLGNDDLFFLGSELPQIGHLSTGWLGLDHALGGGWPINQWSEIIGEESHGKTAVVLKTIAHNQALDPEFTVAWIAAEHYSSEYAEMCGVDNDRVVVIDTNVMEDAYDAVVEFLDSRSVDLVVIDSFPALVATSEDEQSMEDFQVGIGARLTSKFTKKARKATRRSVREDERPVTGIMINQWRESIGVRYGDPRTTPGGKAKNYFFYARVEVRRDDWITVSKDRVGQTILARIRKNKAGRPELRASVDFYFDDTPPFHAGDYDRLKDIVGVALATNVVELKGSYYHFGGEKWQGRARLEQAVYQDVDLQNAITAAVLGEAVAADLAETVGTEEMKEEEPPKPRRRRTRK